MQSHKASFVKLRSADLESSNKVALLSISVGQKPHEGSKFAATLALINETFDSCVIAVNDTLQRHTLSALSKTSPESLSAVALLEGDQWIDRNMPLIKKIMTKECRIKRWDDWLHHDSYKNYRVQINQLYNADNTFKEIIDFLADDFAHRLIDRGYDVELHSSIAKSKEYLLEECAAMCIWYDEGYAFDIYPSIRNKAIEYGFSKVKADVYNKRLFGVGLKFKRSEELMDTSKMALEKIMEILPAHVYWKNTEGKFLGCNKNQSLNYGLKRSIDLIGKYEKNFLKKDVLDRIKNNDREIVDTRSHQIFEEETYINKQKKWVLSHKAPMIYNNDVIGIVGVSIDISHQKQLERKLIKQTRKLSDALIERKRFFNNLSHEIRTPVHIISSLVEELYSNVNYLSKEEISSFLENLMSSNKRLLELVTDLLELAKSAQRKSSYDIKSHDIVKTVTQCINECSGRASVKHHILRDNIALDYDDIKISQVLRNILDNGIKYSADQKLVVDTAVKNNFFVISIKNRGSPLSEENLSKIFDPFYRCEDYKYKIDGTGLGLSICKEIISAHRGSIWAESHGGYNIFHFQLPIQE